MQPSGGQLLDDGGGHACRFERAAWVLEAELCVSCSNDVATAEKSLRDNFAIEERLIAAAEIKKPPASG